MSGMSGDDLQARDRIGSTNSEVDARSIFGGIFGKQSASPYPVLPTSLEAEEYNMSHKRRGKCVIFNNRNFEIHTKLKILGKQDYSDDDCFVCCFLTHGETDVLYGTDGKFPVSAVMEPFHGDVCSSLLGKPKLFFIQACRGDRLDSGTQAVLDTADSPNRIYRFYSWRNTMQGSWFIQALCSVLRQRAHVADLLSMLTVVCRRVALDYESYTPNDLHMHRKKQVPFITSTLTRQVYLRAKPGAAYS
ncbi:hypothetical protein MRX96_046079 [Rhipicephalus microplus]